MFLLLTGASGAGKSTARRLVAAELAGEVECVELAHVVTIPPRPTIAWRQQATEAVVQHAVTLQAAGRHLLLAGDPVAAGEVVASPSADKLDAIAVCLLDVNAEAQATRLTRRGDDPSLLADHQAFASWMRAHALDPNHKLNVLTTNGWDAMRWERLARLERDGGWSIRVLDTSAYTTDEVADQVLSWCRSALGGQVPAIRVAGDGPSPGSSSDPRRRSQE